VQTAHASATLPASWTRVVRNEREATKIARRVRRRAAKTAEVDPVTSAAIAELRYVDDRALAGIRRVGSKARVRYVDANGRTVSNAKTIQRIRSLAIPPAWTDVWICPDPEGHLQATGRDARGRKQYRYHPRWRAVRDEVKFSRLLVFASALPRIRRRAAADLRKPGLPREKVIAAVVQLLEKTLIRVGNEEYAAANHSFGLTTMRDGHAKINGSSVRFEFRGKSGVTHAIDLRDARLARIVKACRDLPGQELFQYVDADGRKQAVGSADVNAYLKETTSQPFTSKDFRTWAGTVLAAQALAEAARKEAAPTKREIKRAVEGVAKQLGNTVAVCRKSYIHPDVFKAYSSGRVIELTTPCERAVVKLLTERVHSAA
jgi:DNA topoisomerase-1